MTPLGSSSLCLAWTALPGLANELLLGLYHVVTTVSDVAWRKRYIAETDKKSEVHQKQKEEPHSY